MLCSYRINCTKSSTHETKTKPFRLRLSSLAWHRNYSSLNVNRSQSIYLLRMTTTSTHWKKMTNPDYFGSHDLMTDSGEYGQITVTIASVSQEKVKGSDGKDSSCIVAKTQETKPIILNKTNCKTITKVLGTPIIERWAGHKVIIGVDKVKAFGDVTDALRVRSTKPVPEKPKDYTKQIEAINACPDMPALVALWQSMDAETKTACLAYKDARKTQLEQTK